MAEPPPDAQTPTVTDCSPVGSSVDYNGVAPFPARFGRYRVVSRLGSGGFGVVYRGYDDELHRDVAIKVPHRQRVASPEDIEAYLNEARNLARLDHPGIVPVYDVGRTDDGLCYVVSKFVEGSDLAARLRQTRPTVSEAVELVAQTAEALHYAHQHRLIHRDIKPANILLDRGGRPVVADLGLALREEDFGTGPACAGTPAYMSPEQARGEGHRVDARTDVYSLGVVFYELLTGRRPFEGKSIAELVEQVTSQEPRPPRQVDANVARELDRICLKCLAKRAADRYSTALDLAEDLRTWQGSRPEKVEAVPAPAPTAGPSPAPVTPTWDRQPVKVVPKGLRPFDAHDAGFFLELLPGPRDASGLPDTLRFWKTRVEESDPDKTFNVGLMYGPSGCGKSSLVKAGLLPRLSPAILVAYVEATPGETEARLLKTIYRRCPDLPASLGLVDALSALRRGRGLPPGKKILLVLDQFEQWLHTRPENANAELVRALRHCDGEHVQCLVLVRDDFWMATTRFLHELEIRLLEGHNSAAVDLFDPAHARKVLRLFGRAYGRLPEGAELSAEEERFLDQAVAGLAAEGKVVPVRLSLFAEMFKGKDWTRASLKEVGGTEGIGVTFLEETFSATTAPPEHRLHQKAARSVLKALLPEQGAEIKGHMRSRQELLLASGYEKRPKDFDDLLRILDSELRLVTPTDPEGFEDDVAQLARSASEGSSTPSLALRASNEERYYQLTHDYLVPALREWLTRKQRETVRGRAELRLAERAAWWGIRPERQQLPPLREWASIQLFTRRKAWTALQRRMMRSATRQHALVLGCALFLLATLLTCAYYVRELARENKSSQAASAVTKLLAADTAEIPRIIDELDELRQWTDPKLAEIASVAPVNSKERLNASLALLPVDRGQVGFLQERLLDARPQDLLVIREAVRPFMDAEATDALWQITEGPWAAKDRKLRAAGALAAFNATSPRWQKAAPEIAGLLVEEARDNTASWVKVFEPVRAVLVEPMTKAVRGTNAETSQAAAIYLRAYDLERLDLLDAAEMFFALVIKPNERKPGQLEENIARLKKHGDKAVAFFAEELEKQPTPSVKDTPLDPNWPAPDPAVVAKIESGMGMVTERFAFCQTLPMAEFDPVFQALPDSYRLTQVRPYNAGGRVQVAAVWRRDGKRFLARSNLSADQIRISDADWQALGLRPRDVAGYVDEKGVERYAAVWAEPELPLTEAQLIVGRTVRHPLMERHTPPKEFAVRTQTLFAVGDELRYCAVWEKPVQALNRPTYYPELGRTAYESWQSKNEFQVDVRVERAPLFSPARLFAAYGAEAEKQIRQDAGDRSGWSKLGWAKFYEGKDQECFDAYDHLIKDRTQGATGIGRAYSESTFALARMGKAQEAKKRLAEFAAEYPKAQELDWTSALVEACLDEGPMSEKLLADYTSAGKNLYWSAIGYAFAAGVVTDKDPAKAKRYAERALDLLEQIFEEGYPYVSDVFVNAYLKPIHDHPRFHELLKKANADRFYAGVCGANRAPFASRESHGLDPAAHLQQCKAWAAEGFRPASIAGAVLAEGQPPVMASVWHRAVVSEEAKDAAARQQAVAAVALIHLGHAERVWPLLRYSEDPRLRTELIHRFAPGGIGLPVLLGRLEAEADLWAKRALLLAAGEFAASDWNEAERGRMTATLRQLYRTHPDPGLHSAAEWLLRRVIPGEPPTALDTELVTKEPQVDRRWFVNGQGQALAVFPGPVEFWMGSPASEPDRATERGERQVEEPRHLCRIPRTFALGTKEVTRAQIEASRPGWFRSLPKGAEKAMPTEDCAALALNWYEAAMYCRWLSEQEGIAPDQMCYPPVADIQAALKNKTPLQLPTDYLHRTGYRLPTEAEWEYSCRAGSVTSRFFGHDPAWLSRYAWYSANSQLDSWPGGQLKPNDFGLFDVYGNAHEFCHDAYRPFRIPSGGRAREDVEQPGPVLYTQGRMDRGMSNDNDPPRIRSAARYKLPPWEQINSGLRVARTLR